RRLARPSRTWRGPSAEPSKAIRTGTPAIVPSTAMAPPERTRGASAGEDDQRADQPPVSLSGRAPDGRPIERIRPSTSEPGGERSLNAPGPRKSRAKPGDRTDARSPRTKVKRRRLPNRGTRSTETDRSSAGPSETFAPPKSSKSQARRQKYARVSSSA